MLNPMRLDGKTILVTGASSGIGRQTAITLSKLGAKVVCVARRHEKLKQTLALLEGEGHVMYAFDLTDVAEIEQFVNTISKESGVFDGFVHCAGDTVTRPLKMNKYPKMINSFNAVYFAFVELMRSLSKQGRFADGGSVVAISSVSVANVHGRKAKVAYSSSRAALECTCRCLAVELAERKIRVNIVEAGLVETEMAMTYVSDNEDSDKVKDFNTRQVLGVIPSKEVANLFGFLLSDAAPHLTGAMIVLDGGYLQG